jgi:hypothetical protein
VDPFTPVDLTAVETLSMIDCDCPKHGESDSVQGSTASYAIEITSVKHHKGYECMASVLGQSAGPSSVNFRTQEVSVVLVAGQRSLVENNRPTSSKGIE